MFQYSPSQIHIIGHSLGAHAAGDVGRRIRGIKRITGKLIMKMEFYMVCSLGGKNLAKLDSMNQTGKCGCISINFSE